MALATKRKMPVAAKAAAPVAPAVNQPQTQTRSVNMTTTKVTVQAYSDEHAKRIAAGLYGVDMGAIISVSANGSTKVTPPKKTQNADFPQHGTRKWVTEYQIFTYAQRLQVGLNKFEYVGLEFVKGGFDEKTKAVKAMKDLALKHRLPMMVQIHKVLEGDSNVCGISEPDMALRPYSVEFKTP
ncbi:hypothetical protein D3C76_613910 [compost metagenome]